MSEYSPDRPQTSPDARQELYRSDPDKPRPDDVDPPETILIVK